MIVNQGNAPVVLQLFSRLADERFSMRSPRAILKDSTVEEGAMLEIAANVGCHLRHRIADGALLIERPCTVERALEIVAQTQQLIADPTSEATFEVSFGDAAPQGDADADGDEDRQFH